MNELTPKASIQPGARSVVMVTSPGQESTLSDVAINLATVCAEVGQKVVLVSTAIFATPTESEDESTAQPLWWLNWPNPNGATATSVEEQQRTLQSDDVNAADIEALLGETGVSGVRRLDLRYFVKHPAQVVIRVPQVIAALRQIVDVVILEVPAYLTMHHGEGLTPYADAILVVGERNSTTMDELRRTKTALIRLAAPVVGVALTGAQQTVEAWGAEDEEDSNDDDSLDETKASDHGLSTGPDDAKPASVLHAPFDDFSENNGATKNGAGKHHSAEAMLVRRDSPEA